MYEANITAYPTSESELVCKQVSLWPFVAAVIFTDIFNRDEVVGRLHRRASPSRAIRVSSLTVVCPGTV